MAVKRVLYVLMLLAAAVALAVVKNGVALFVFVCLLVFPLISLGMLLFVRKSVKFKLNVQESCMRGGALLFTICVSASPRFCVGGIKVIAEIENTTFHKTEYKSFMFNDLSFEPHVFEYRGSDSGRICVKCDRLKLVGIFGIFSVKVKCNAFAEAIVSPVLYGNIDVSISANSNDAVYGDTSLPKKGGDITEIFNVRDYVPGDSLGAVHWKLSGKFDSLKSKEFGATDDRKILILVDMSREKYENTANDDQLNAVLDVAVSISNALITMGYSHSVGWFGGGIFESSEVSDGSTFVHMVNELMSIKVNDGDEDDLFYLSRTAECAVFTKIIFVSSFVDSEEFKGVSGAEMTVIEVNTGYGVSNDHGVRIINIPYTDIVKSLAVCVI